MRGMLMVGEGLFRVRMQRKGKVFLFLRVFASNRYVRAMLYPLEEKRRKCVLAYSFHLYPETP